MHQSRTETVDGDGNRKGRKTRAILIGAAAGGAILAARLARKEANLAGAVVMITGGSRGLGLALAREFAREGCRLVLCARDRAELSAILRDPELTGRVSTFECDVSRQDQVDRMVRDVVTQYGRIDVLVANAGEIEVGPLQSMSLRDFEAAMETMFWGAVHPALAVMPHMIWRKSGRIVVITSIGGKVAVPHLLPYSCAKFAAVGFSEGLRAELAGTGVKVTTVAPGLMRTGSFRNAWFKGNASREATWFSLGATLPAISMAADRAARQIVSATKRGQAELILSVPAKLLALSHGIFPGMTSDVLGFVNRWMLPHGAEPHKVRGRDVRFLDTRFMKALTVLGRRVEGDLHQTL